MVLAAERSFFFSGSKNRQIYGFFQEAVRQVKGALLYIHPFAEEKNISHYIMANMLRQASQNGYSSLRIDLSGTGDSESELNEVELEDWRQDILAALEQLKQKSQCDKVYVMGLRSGFNLGFWACEQSSIEVNGYLGLQPLPDSKLFMQQFIRQKISTEIASGAKSQKGVKALREECRENGVLEVIGYPLGEGLLSGMEKLTDDISGLAFQGPISLLSIGSMEASPVPMQRWVDKLRENCPKIQLLHIMEEGFWDKYWSWKAPKTELIFLETLRNWEKEL